MNKAVIVEAKRTPIGRKSKMLQDYQPERLMAPILSYLSKDITHYIEDAIIGNVVGPGGNIGRLSALEAGLPLSIPGMTIDRQCSAGLEAIRTACYYIQGGAGSCYLAGGVESASTSPFPTRARFAPDSIGDPDMGIAAENVAKKYHITREMQDEYALLSHERSWDAFNKGHFNSEIIAIDEHDKDEVFNQRRDMSRMMNRAKAIFVKENGTVTTTNSCAINDGASAVVVMEEKLAHKLHYKPVLRFIDSYVTGIHPHFPAISPVSAIQELITRNDLTIKDIDLFEINEAFAVKIVACAQELHIPYDRINVSGGALTIGHPYGASGALLVTRLFHEVQRRPTCKYVIAAIGSGGGIGLATLFEVI
ncbi:acetyl-CoA C-acyltransferase [Bacillus massiliigorillae]|uniref:acetyl-CoA C-acyltransferase n=1 Tax=Bacillus massiliigorillae TaxID=1243664 RepID=UPI0003A3BD3C|nr:acetyl-CoA C-acyltransferase [Bacillus massiliigorillae]